MSEDIRYTERGDRIFPHEPGTVEQRGRALLERRGIVPKQSDQPSEKPVVENKRTLTKRDYEAAIDVYSATMRCSKAEAKSFLGSMDEWVVNQRG